MATAALLTLAPAHGSFPSGTAAPLWGTNATNMHVTRPKSAKGRTRPSCSHLQSVAACPYHVPPSPPPAPPQELVNSRGSSSTKPPLPSSRVSPEEIRELLQQVPLRTSSSLTRYKVLPSIGRQGTGSRAVEALAEQTSWLRLSGEQEHAPKIPTLPGEQGSTCMMSESDVPREEGSCARCPLEKERRKMRQESPWMSTLSLEEPPKEEPCVLLAVRAPSGQRFEHHFKPTDSLQMVLAMAEQKMAAQYQSCSIETMEVPRRSFSDLTRSLQECGILHKSVLCIQQEQHDADL
ncbi:UBX10 protein, partial [Hemiprocne comata]|nr:UBX10 protein [Hemiprocne comata]